MSVLNFIKIRGLDGEPGPDTGEYFEIFQGIAGSSCDTIAPIGPGEPVELPLPITPICEDEALAEEIWQGQNEKLLYEKAYCDQLQHQFREKQQKISGTRDRLLDIVQEIIGESLGNAAGVAASGAVLVWTGNAALAAAAGWLAGIMTEVSLEWGIDALLLLLTHGNELLDGIKAENDHLLDVEKSRENYEYREIALARHREDIKVVLEQIKMGEKDLEIKTLIDTNALLESLIALQYNNQEIRLPGGVDLSLSGKYHGGM